MVTTRSKRSKSPSRRKQSKSPAKASNGGSSSNGNGRSSANGDAARVTTTSVFLFAPNIIGYVRILLLLAAFWYANRDPILFMTLFGLSFGLDVLDGPVARALGQSTRFGAALDLLTDKFSGPGLFCILTSMYTDYAAALTLLLMLDAASHWFHMQATLLRGSTSHKIIDPTQNVVVRLFYGSKPFFAWTCLGHEMFLCALYLRWWALDGRSAALAPLAGPLTWAARAFFPSFVSKSIVHVFQLISACEGIAKLDAERITKERGKAKKE